jgi:alkanesulfonate monooxygenase SsuD/methylene tetrahydromethanopterin reductase-like flavin-dependent oxidoreductase (luciferase family)
MPFEPALGVIFHPRFPPETLIDFARRAESAGFDELWLWDDSFLPGAYTAAGMALTATRTIKVGIGLMPATAQNPLFTAMEITTLARAFPDRFLPGIGHGVASWLAQIGAAPQSSMTALQEIVIAVRRLLNGEQVTVHSDVVNLEAVQMQMTAVRIPPLYVGAMREKTLRLAGRIGDGTILAGQCSAPYVRWARRHIEAGMGDAGRAEHRVVTYFDVKVGPGPAAARLATRQALAARLPWLDIQLEVLGIREEVSAFLQKYQGDAIAPNIPDAWVDAFTASGTPEHAAEAIQRVADAGSDSVVMQPLDGDPACLDEYIDYLMPILRPGGRR